MSKTIDPDSPFSAIPPEEVDNLPALEKKSDAVAFTLSGMALTRDGEVRRSKYLRILTDTLDDYTDIQLSTAEAERVKRQISNWKYGAISTLPILCTGDLCPIKSRCVYYQIGQAPVGRSCLLELNLVKQWQLNYLEEFQVDPDNFTEMTMVNELVEVELQLNRINLYLSSHTDEAFGIVDQSIGFDKNGEPVTQRVISQFFELREKLLARKHKLVKLMVGDRQEKYKREAALKQREAADPSTTMARIKEQMENLARELSKSGAKVAAMPTPPPPPPAITQVLENTGETKVVSGVVVGSNGGVDEEVEVVATAKPLSPDDILPD